MHARMTIFFRNVFSVWLTVLLVASSLSNTSNAQAKAKDLAPALMSVEQRLSLFDLLVREIVRIDGDGLIVRETRPESWSATVARLRSEAANATTTAEYGHVFHRLRATYPNSHSGVMLADDYRRDWMSRDVRLPISFRAEIVTPNVARPVLRIATIEADERNSAKSGESLPMVGDEVVAMNHRPVADWWRENEIFCRLPLAWQCTISFHRNLARGHLFWHPETPLVIEVQRDGKRIQFTIQATNVAMQATTKPPATNAPPTYCSSAALRMPDGFTSVWASGMLCVFAIASRPDTLIWRIPSFASEQARTYDAKPGQYRSVADEVEHFNNTFWKSNSARVKHVVVDVAGNGGGEDTTPWLRLLLREPFQSDFVRFKKIREFDAPRVNAALFWNSTGSLFQAVEAMRRDGTFASTRENEWLPAIPQFCPRKDVPCPVEKHQPANHQFMGDVSVVIDPFCNSACVNFANVAKTRAKARIIGLSDTGDSTFSRLQIHFGFDAAGRASIATEDRPHIVTFVGMFIVAATLSATPSGTTLSAAPLTPDVVVSRHWQQTGDQWGKAALSAALEATYQRGK